MLLLLLPTIVTFDSANEPISPASVPIGPEHDESSGGGHSDIARSLLSAVFALDSLPAWNDPEEVSSFALSGRVSAHVELVASQGGGSAGLATTGFLHVKKTYLGYVSLCEL